MARFRINFDIKNLSDIAKKHPENAKERVLGSIRMKRAFRKPSERP